jgi:benzoyl-CoA reductase/2-hydroxyglutaryl-CoA dehydratase subunit BcrC/BadD/HgdB
MVVSHVSTDIMRYKSLLNLSIEFLNSREHLKYLKQQKHKHLIGCFMPNVELICAANAVPTYAVRMKPFGRADFLKALNLTKSILGTNIISSVIQSIAKIDNSNSLEGFLQGLIDSIFNQWDTAYHLGIDLGVPSDECYGIKAITGMWAEKGKNLSATLFASVRCSAFEKMYESLTNYAPGIFIDVPPDNTPEAHDVAVQEVYKVAEQLEHITGHAITNSDLYKVAEATNACKDYSWKLIEIALGDYYPFNPITMAQFLALIEIGFQDYLGDPYRFRDLLKGITLEFDRIGKHTENVFDASKYKKILFTSRFGGWDHIVEDYAFEQGGRIIYADWFLYGFMDRIKLTGDMFENYATYLQSNAQGFCPNNAILIEKIAQFVKDYKIDAVIYNQLFGCHSLSTGYTWLREHLVREEIPSTLVSFNNVGENREQLKTRVVALMELLK